MLVGFNVKKEAAMSFRRWFLGKPPVELMNRILSGLMIAIITPLVQTAKKEVDEAVSTISSIGSGAVLSMLLQQVSLLSVLSTIRKKSRREFP